MKSFFDLDSLLFRHYAHDYTNGNHGLAMTFFCLTVGLIILLCALLPDKQKLVPGVLVVGGNAKHSIKANRERFRQNAKEMLQEGYKRVCYLLKYSVPESFLQSLGERRLLLRPQSTGRTSDDSLKILGGAQDGPNRSGRLCCYVYRGNEISLLPS